MYKMCNDQIRLVMVLFLAIIFNDSLLVCRFKTSFCMLTLYSATLLICLLVQTVFLLESLQRSTFSIMTCANRQFTSSFNTCVAFTAFSCLIPQVRPSGTTLNRSGQHPCLFMVLEKKLTVSPIE